MEEDGYLRGTFQTEGTASTKALRQEHMKRIPGPGWGRLGGGWEQMTVKIEQVLGLGPPGRSTQKNGAQEHFEQRRDMGLP